MKTVELKKRLINHIQETNDEGILEEVLRLLNIEAEDIEVYKLNEKQKNAISEARKQIKEGDFLTEDQANTETDEWLNR